MHIVPLIVLYHQDDVACEGIPGSGKTTISAIDEFKELLNEYPESEKMLDKNTVIEQRLQCSVIDILEGTRMLDVALKYNYETNTGFTKAFKRYF